MRGVRTSYLRSAYDWYLPLSLSFPAFHTEVLMSSVRGRRAGYEDLGSKTECNQIYVSSFVPSPVLWEFHGIGVDADDHLRYPGMLDNVRPHFIGLNYGYR